MKFAALGLIALLLATVSCGGRSFTRDPNTLVVLELADAGTLNPLFSSNYYSSVYESLIFDQLVNLGPDFEPIPDLATSWKSTKDGLHWTLELRRGVTWSDGAPFNSTDVVWTYRAMLAPDTGFPYRGQYAYVRAVAADGPYRVRFDLSQTNALFVTGALAWPILPAHVLAKIPFKGQRQENFGEHPIGTGPYTLERWQHDEQAAFVRNPRFWGVSPSIPRISFRIVLDDQARIDAMINGEADVDDGIGAASYQTLKERGTNLRFLHVRDLYADFLYVNLRRPGLGDLAVRRAMMYGWDRPQLVRGLLRGDADLALGVTPPALRIWYDSRVRSYSYDPVLARKMLDMAGYRIGPDGVRHKGNVRLSYALTFPGNGQASAALEIATEFQADMREIGIGITLQQIDYATFLTETNEERYELALSGWGGTPDPDQLTLFASDQFPPAGNNIMHYRNPRMDRDVHLGLSTIDPVKRKAYYDDMQRLVADDVPVLFFDFPYSRAALSPRVQFDFAHALPDQYLFLNVARWKLTR